MSNTIENMRQGAIKRMFYCIVVTKLTGYPSISVYNILPHNKRVFLILLNNRGHPMAGRQIG